MLIYHEQTTNIKFKDKPTSLVAAYKEIHETSKFIIHCSCFMRCEWSVACR